MLNLKKGSLKLLSKVALSSAKKEVDSACVLWGYQPKMPEQLKNRAWRG